MVYACPIIFRVTLFPSEIIFASFEKLMVFMYIIVTLLVVIFAKIEIFITKIFIYVSTIVVCLFILLDIQIRFVCST